jgi:hypothetical protein
LAVSPDDVTVSRVELPIGPQLRRPYREPTAGPCSTRGLRSPSWTR